MKLKEFLELYDGAPVSLDEIAGRAEAVEDENLLSYAAKSFGAAREIFLIELEKTGFEFG